MESDYTNLLPTPAQQLVDRQFLDEIEESYVAPLVEDLKMLILGYEFMKWSDRWFHVLKLNEPLFGQGDFLEFRGMLVYSGKLLGNECEASWADITVKQYRPRFLGIESNLMRNELGGEEFISDMEHFLRYERELYDTLHVSYRAALLYNYIKSKVIARPEEILAFLLGCNLGTGETLSTSKLSVRPFAGSTNAYGGWEIRIRDAVPSARLMAELGMWIRNEASAAESLIKAAGKDVSNEGGAKTATPLSRTDYTIVTFEESALSKKPRRQRTPDPKTELACRYIYELERKGVVIDGRKGDIGYAKIAADLKHKYGDKVRDYAPDTLSRVYRAWKKRNGV